jgi:hypothetical protein
MIDLSNAATDQFIGSISEADLQVARRQLWRAGARCRLSAGWGTLRWDDRPTPPTAAALS